MLNIKRPETYELAKQLADRTGQSITDAVTEALREKIGRLDADHAAALSDRRARIREIQQQFRDLPGEPFGSVDIDTILYDAEGLPR